jgi:redox-sensing transcriptional repressor
MKPEKTPDIIVSRLPLYLRTLARLMVEGRTITSSQDLGQRLGISPAQVRKDLSHFGEFGKQGTGYRVDHLEKHLRRILHVDREWEVALVGAGDLGHALAHYKGFHNRGFRISLIFDNDPAKIGQTLNTMLIQDSANMASILQERGIVMAMIAVSAEAAQGVADELIRAGVRGILNYTPSSLNVPAHVHVQHIDPGVHLQRITYYL